VQSPGPLREGLRRAHGGPGGAVYLVVGEDSVMGFALLRAGSTIITNPAVTLSGANLQEADLSRADSRGANHGRAELAGAYLAGAYLGRANSR
jgi:hypothetical protein